MGLLLALMTTASAAARAQDAAEAQYFKDKTVRIVVGYGPGGGFDTYARMIAPYLARTLGASVIVENLPGAGGITALNRTAQSPPDGLTLQIANGTGAALSQFFEIPAVRYNLLELSHLGTITVSPWLWLVGPNSPIHTAADAMKPGVRLSWAASGPIDGLADGAVFTCEALKVSCRVIIGYKGTNDALLAVIRGEMDAIYLSDSTANALTRSGARPILTIGRRRSDLFAATPTIFEAVNLDPEATWLMEYRMAADALGRIVVTPPKMSPNRLRFLRTALMSTLADPGLVAEARRTERFLNYLGAEETTANLRKVLEEPTPAQKARLLGIIAKAQ